MIPTGLIYAKAGVTPDDWESLTVIDLGANLEVDSVLEVNTAEGWLLRHFPGEGPAPESPQLLIKSNETVMERREGRFELRRRDES